MNSMKGFEKWSCKSREKEVYSLGEHDIRRWYQRDIDQITHSTCFRKLQRKSQLLSEKDPRSRSRMIHTIEVSRIAMEISEKLGLSKELTEAICLAHDIGTSPYGCVGNTFLRQHAKEEFSHEMAGAYMLLKISQKRSEEDAARIEAQMDKDNSKAHNFSILKTPELEITEFPRRLYASRAENDKDDPQYNLHHISPEIVDGVLHHGDSGIPNTLEGQVVRFADNIAYLSQDVEDLITTKIARPTSYTKYSAQKLSYSKVAPDGSSSLCAMSWDEIDGIDGAGSLKDAFNETRGRRIAALVGRFVKYNLQQLEAGKLQYRKSSILNTDIPILECDSGTQFLIDFIWNYIELHYETPLIKTSNCLQLEKMKQLWEILDNTNSKSSSYRTFVDRATQDSLFSQFSDEWRKAFFISHLSWFDVDLIIDSYHERNNTFELDISY